MPGHQLRTIRRPENGTRRRKCVKTFICVKFLRFGTNAPAERAILYRVMLENYTQVQVTCAFGSCNVGKEVKLS